MKRLLLTASAIALSIAPALAQSWRDDNRHNAGRRQCQWEQVDVGTYTNSDNRNQPDRGPRFDRNWNRCR